mmetsp:Transcript_30547/g.91275  ORF Transcript_30547/g.91275 Transcript_30547/m.91275 type:complete len:100 (+) Transcript_30547:1549-1848(+)
MTLPTDSGFLFISSPQQKVKPCILMLQTPIKMEPWTFTFKMGLGYLGGTKKFTMKTAFGGYRICMNTTGLLVYVPQLSNKALQLDNLWRRNSTFTSFRI